MFCVELCFFHTIPFLCRDMQVDVRMGRTDCTKWPLLRVQGEQFPFPISESEKANYFCLEFC